MMINKFKQQPSKINKAGNGHNYYYYNHLITTIMIINYYPYRRFEIISAIRFWNTDRKGGNRMISGSANKLYKKPSTSYEDKDDSDGDDDDCNDDDDDGINDDHNKVMIIVMIIVMIMVKVL